LDVIKIIRDAEQSLSSRFAQLQEIAYANQTKILNSFQNHRIREYHFSPSSGYGYGDLGRQVLEEIYADIFGTEDALVRTQIVSGTHAISACLFGLLKPGDKLISAVGSPYDTLCKVIGKDNEEQGTLVGKGICYKEVALTNRGQPDFKGIADSIREDTKMVLIQRSRGYTLRASLTVDQIEKITEIIKKKNPDTIVMVDNCYGEFTDTREPSQCGADIMAGSLIKNPGGGLCLSGGYIVGKKVLVEKVADYITAPGLGKELGASLIDRRYIYQGLFLAPHIVFQALKGVLLMAYIFEQSGYKVSPGWSEVRGDIVQAIQFDRAEDILKFCQIIQSSSPVDSDVKLEFGDMPGYTDKIIMAAGTFVQGSSIELSCDAPLREPYSVYIQGGITYEHIRYAVMKLAETFLIK